MAMRVNATSVLTVGRTAKWLLSSASWAVLLTACSVSVVFTLGFWLVHSASSILWVLAPTIFLVPPKMDSDSTFWVLFTGLQFLYFFGAISFVRLLSALSQRILTQ